MFSKPWTAWCAVSCAAFLAGVAVGRFALAPDARPASGALGLDADSQQASPDGSSAREEHLERALTDSWVATLRLAAKVDSLEALLAELRAQGLDGRQVVQGAIANLSDRELQSILASTAQLSATELEGVGDLRAFAARLAEIAMEDLVEPGAPPRAADRVSFTLRPETVNPEPLARERFEAQTNRIYAVFPTDRYAQDAVMIKWYRRDRPQILLFERYPIRPGDAYGYVWLYPKGGWEPGEYQVNVYAADESVTSLATGSYTVQK
ncbi:MAG: hypothetical protein OEM49_10865 [Myxococcales bacterium]|nr:hypothetical protein [Myxococcales bacterium]MDH5307344.1 hypothetical protein [Myxococcales bacterium]